MWWHNSDKFGPGALQESPETSQEVERQAAPIMRLAASSAYVPPDGTKKKVRSAADENNEAHVHQHHLGDRHADCE